MFNIPNMFGTGPTAYPFMPLGPSHAGDTSPDVLPIDHTSSEKGFMHSPHYLTGHTSRPSPPIAHGGRMFLPPSLSSPPISRPLEDCSHNNTIQSMPGMRSPQPLDISSASPLVVPHPMKTSRTPKSYHCRMCDQVFDSKSEMLVHSQQIHKQDPKPYKCSTCHKSFANSSYLSQHTRIHAGVKPYKCQICERRFTQLCHLQQHIRTHTGEKPYKCQHPGCGKAFSQLSNLQSHSRSHMTDRPYRCNSCYKCFADEQSLREHIPKHSDTKHLKTHICRVCGKSYTQETYLARHMTKHSGEGTPSPRTPITTKPGGGPNMPLMMMQHHQHQGEPLDVKCEIDGGPGCESMPLDVMSRPSSAFMPLPHQYNAGMLNSSMPSSFSFPPPPHMPTPQLSHLSSSAPSRYFPFDPFQKRDMMDRRMSMSREGVIADSLLSLQQIKNFATSHPVFPKSEPSSPLLNKDFP